MIHQQNTHSKCELQWEFSKCYAKFDGTVSYMTNSIVCETFVTVIVFWVCVRSLADDEIKLNDWIRKLKKKQTSQPP